MGKISQKYFFKIFSYLDKNKEVKDVSVHYGQKWDEIKTDNEVLNSIFESVDNGDGIIQAEELNTLNKVVAYIDNLVKKTKNNGILEQKELKKFAKELKQEKIDINQLPEVNSNKDGTWSEGLDRNITTIQLAKREHETTYSEELRQIGEEQGFSVEEVESGGDPWIEDSSIRRADGKQYVQFYRYDKNYNEEVKKMSIEGRKVVGGQGRVIIKHNSFDREIDTKERYYGTSYLEGGNVLNTCLADGTPAAIVGESSIAYTMKLMGLENTEENIEIAKQQIAKDLGLKPENVTFIPQYGFHIDMLYRPLHNGEIAVPDYDESIIFLEQLKDSISTVLKEQTNLNLSSEDISAEKEKIAEIDKLIRKLIALNKSSFETRELTEKNLADKGYKIVKIPAFTDTNNFMNGVGGTSAKTGETFYITNKPEIPELEEFIRDKFQATGIDKVYFVSTTEALENNGGIDCLTQEK